MISFITFMTVALAVQQVHSASDPCDPQMIHIALSDAFQPKPSSGSPIKIIFHTVKQCASAYISLETWQGTQVVTATTVNYHNEDYNQDEYYSSRYKGGNYQTYVHIFDLPELDFSETYSYTCYGYDDNSVSQGPFTFYLPSPYNQGQETRAIMFGDMDISENGMLTINQLTSLVQTDFASSFIHIGDMAYDLVSHGGKDGDDFMKAIQPITASMPYMVTAGNHEYFNNYSNFNLRFKMPMYAKSQNHYYSFNLGNIHFASFDLDVIMDYPKVKAGMLAWLEADLKQAVANRKSQPWIIVYTHRPIYCSYTPRDDCVLNPSRFAAFDTLLQKYKVDLFVTGHVHSYERNLPIKNGKVASFQVMPNDDNFNYIVNPSAPVFVTQGTGGQYGEVSDPPAYYDAKSYNVKIDITYSYLSVRSSNSTHMLVENFQSEDNVVNDFFYIIKSKESKYTKLPYY